jgi:hypothetical protein
MKNKVKFTDDTTLAADGIRDGLIMRRNNGYSLIKCNLLSIFQLLEVQSSNIWHQEPSSGPQTPGVQHEFGFK